MPALGPGPGGGVLGALQGGGYSLLGRGEGAPARRPRHRAAPLEQQRLEAEAAQEVAEVADVAAEEDAAVMQQREQRPRLGRLAIGQEEDDVARSSRSRRGASR
jgi:hypothetical protein